MLKTGAGQRRTKSAAVGKNKGQVTLESTAAFIAFITLLFGIFNILLWFSANFRGRHLAYERGRIFSAETAADDIRSPASYRWASGFHTSAPLYVFDRENPALHRGDIDCENCDIRVRIETGDDGREQILVSLDGGNTYISYEDFLEQYRPQQENG